MKIAITGASGFIGNELIKELLQNTDVKITALTRGSSPKNPEALGLPESEKKRVSWRVTDYSKSGLEDVLTGADIVVHLAAVRGTTDSREDYDVNEEITEKILNAMTVCGVKRIIFASSISVYDDVMQIPWKENSPLQPRTMYGASKIECERLIRELAEKKDFKFSILRIAQVLGLKETRRGMMNVFLDTAAAKGQIKVIGESKAKRQYIYVDDLIKIITMLIERKAKELEEKGSEIINVGMPEAYTNLEIAQIINEVFANPTPIDYDNSKPETIKPSEMDIGYLKEKIKYMPRDMKESIEDIKIQIPSFRGLSDASAYLTGKYGAKSPAI